MFPDLNLTLMLCLSMFYSKLTWRIETRDINGSGDGIQMDENLQLQVKTDKENIFVDFVSNQSKRMDLFYFQTNRNFGFILFWLSKVKNYRVIALSLIAFNRLFNLVFCCHFRCLSTARKKRTVRLTLI